MEVLRRAVSGLAWYIVGLPLNILYFNGPAFFGFWEGKSREDICSQLTNVDSSFWASGEAQREACMDILGRKFSAFYLSMGVLFYFVLLLYVINTGCSLLKGVLWRRHGKGEVITYNPDHGNGQPEWE